MHKFDLHIHTSASHDSSSSLTGILRYARKRQLRGIAITDHDRLAGAEVDDLALETGIWIIRGNEVRTEIGDLIGLFLSKPVRNTKAVSLIDEIHDQGGVAILAHPYKYIDHYPPAIIDKLDAVETVNARWRDLNGAADIPKVRALLSAVRGRSAGSDAHFSFEVGRACWVTSELVTPDDLKKSICHGTGSAQLISASGWLDEASQCVKFMKKPTARQFARIVYWSLRRLLLSPRSGLS